MNTSMEGKRVLITAGAAGIGRTIGLSDDQRDVLRQYEIWLKTGSPRAHGILRSLGVEPTLVPTGRLLS